MAAVAEHKIEVFNTTGIDGERISQYMGIRRKGTRVVNGKTFIVAIYGAYNAMGLIGSEHNGVVVLNDTDKYVVTDKLECASSGWYGATKNQVALFTFLMELSDEHFLTALSKTERFRGEHTL